MINVPDSENNVIIDRNNLFARNPKIYPVPPDKPDDTPRIFAGYTEIINKNK
jgi:hypothetical protein